MSLARGRIVRQKGERRLEVPMPLEARGAIVKQPVADALAAARRIVAEAEARAREIEARAQVEVGAARDAARIEGRAEGAQALAAAYVRLRREEASRDERDLARSIDLARAMAERLLGEALVIDPSRVIAIAKEALTSARKARRIVIVAHPEDAAALSRDSAALALETSVIEIHADPARARGSLLFHTDMGTLDADLSLQLDRLAAALREGQEG